MKRTILSLIAAFVGVSAYAQTNVVINNYYTTINVVAPTNTVSNSNVTERLSSAQLEEYKNAVIWEGMLNLRRDTAFKAALRKTYMPYPPYYVPRYYFLP